MAQIREQSDQQRKKVKVTSPIFNMGNGLVYDPTTMTIYDPVTGITVDAINGYVYSPTGELIGVIPKEDLFGTKLISILRQIEQSYTPVMPITPVKPVTKSEPQPQPKSQPQPKPQPKKGDVKQAKKRISNFSRLASLVSKTAKVLDQLAGVTPTRQRRPLVQRLELAKENIDKEAQFYKDLIDVMIDYLKKTGAQGINPDVFISYAFPTASPTLKKEIRRAIKHIFEDELVPKY